MSEEDKSADEALLTFKVKTSSDGLHTITMPESASVLDLKNKLATAEYENVPIERQRLIYSGRVLKNEESLATYKIKNGNTIHMVKSAASNAAQNPANNGTSASSTPGAGAQRAAPGVPTNMAAGTANNPLANLTGARYAGQVNLPSRDLFGVDGGVSYLSYNLITPTNNHQMGAPPSEDQVADMLSDPATAQIMNEALNNPQMVDMMIQANPTLRALGPAAREMLQSPLFRQMMTDPNMIRQAARMQRQMGGGGTSSFPAPGITDTTPASAGGIGAQTTQGQAAPQNPFADLFGGGGANLGAGNPFAGLFQPPPQQQGQTQGQDATQSPPSATATSPTPQQPGQTGQPGTGEMPPNPFANLFSGGAGAHTNPFAYGLPPPTPEQMRQAMQMLGQMGGGEGGAGGFGGFGAGGTASPPPPADTRPPEEMYAEQLRALNDMGFFDFEANVRALRRSGGSVQGAVEQLLG